MKKTILASILFFTPLGAALYAAQVSPYAGQENRQIKAVSPDDIRAYLSGKGMGLAKAAELNGYPGPSHVLALASELALTTTQKQLTESLFQAMELRAIAHGQLLVEEERRLDEQFAGKTITPEILKQSLQRIGELQARVRQAHLDAHLAQLKILTAEQVSKYVMLRGYNNAPQSGEHTGHSH